MKFRTPTTFEGAITHIMGVLTPEVAAEAVGRSESLVRKWGDPDDPAMPNLAQALQLDIAYTKEGHGAPPLIAVYLAVHGAATKDCPEPAASCLTTGALHVQSSVGELAKAVVDVTCPKSEGGASITPNEAKWLATIFNQVLKAVQSTEKALKNRLNDNANP